MFWALPSLAQVTYADPRSNWLPVLLLLVIAIGFAVVNIAASLIIGPGRTGDAKSAPYESGMVPIGDTRQRFNVRFYIVAMIFLVFDVQIVFFYPFATILAPYSAMEAGTPGAAQAGVILVSMAVFVAILLLAYFYALGKGVFRFD
ncbi:MAG: NADH-quinone oxidoreductase subunit A [Phycisphaerae bacterium]